MANSGGGAFSGAAGYAQGTPGVSTWWTVMERRRPGDLVFSSVTSVTMAASTLLLVDKDGTFPASALPLLR